MTWRGRGFIVPILALLAVCLPLEVKDTSLMYLLHGVSFILAGILCWILGSRWNKGQNHYSEAVGKFHWKDIFEVGAHNGLVVDRYNSPSHSFTLIKVQYWSITFFTIAIICMVLGIIKG